MEQQHAKAVEWSNKTEDGNDRIAFARAAEVEQYVEECCSLAAHNVSSCA
jgi:hypothetical protein